jgi:hypothetical protein
MKIYFTFLMLFCMLLPTLALAGVGSKNTVYVGGTLSSVKEGTEGKSSTADEKSFVFQAKGQQLVIPYSSIDGLEYGQKAGRRVAMAIFISPLALFSKKRKHFLTINYIDAKEKQQAVVFELGKDIVRTTLATLEARTGRKIEYQDEEARNSSKGN